MPPDTNISQPLLEVRDLKVHFNTRQGTLKAVAGVSFSINPGETLALVGESGCGKSVTAFSILKLVQSPPGIYAGGQIIFQGTDLLTLDERSLNEIRGNKIGIVFQEPSASLNPILTIGEQIMEVLARHRKSSKKERRELAVQMLERVGIPAAEARLNSYPHQLSGGMKQRAMIAMALVCHPELLVADEPTTALDVTIQAQILELINDLKRELEMGVLLITHNLGVVAETCDRVAVMYAGKIVEYSPVDELFENPRHPYTRALFRSLPSLASNKKRLHTIPGAVPSPLDLPTGCSFRTRCDLAQKICETEPALIEIKPGRFSACHFADTLIGTN